MNAIITATPFGYDRCINCKHYVAVSDYCRVIKKGVNAYAIARCRYFERRKLK
jgi:hypothetical protein